MRPRLSACLTIYNEEMTLESCLKNIQAVVDEIVIIHDGPCSDRSLEIAKRFTDKIYITPKRNGSAEFIRSISFEHATGEWVLRLDPDEHLSPELKESIPGLLTNKDVDAYAVRWVFLDTNGNILEKKGKKHKRILFRRSKMYHIGLPHMTTQTRGTLKHVSHILEHRFSNNDQQKHKLSIDWAKNKNRAKTFAHLIGRDMSKINTYNCKLSDSTLKQHRKIYFQKDHPLIAIFILPGYSFMLHYFKHGFYKNGWIGFVNALNLPQYHLLSCLALLKNQNSTISNSASPKFGIFSYNTKHLDGGIGRHVNQMLDSLPNDQYLFFSPAQNKKKNHIQTKTYLKSLKNIGYSIWLHSNIKALIKSHTLSVINLHTGPGALWLIKKVSIPVVITCHHTYYQEKQVIKLPTRKLIQQWLEKKTYQNANQIIAVSQDVKNALIQGYDIPEGKITIINNGVNTQEFYPKYGVSTINKSLLFVGRLEKRKGWQFLLDSFSKVIHQDPNIKLFIIGDGHDREEIKRVITDNNLSNNVTLLGQLSDEELNDWYNKAACVIIPSKVEGFGLATIEAMATKTPVIVTNVDGLKNIVTNNINGRVVDYDDSNKLAETIIEVLSHDNKKIIEQAFEDINDKYTVISMVTKFQHQIIQAHGN